MVDSSSSRLWPERSCRGAVVQVMECNVPSEQPRMGGCRCWAVFGSSRPSPDAGCGHGELHPDDELLLRSHIDIDRLGGPARHAGSGVQRKGRSMGKFTSSQGSSMYLRLRQNAPKHFLTIGKHSVRAWILGCRHRLCSQLRTRAGRLRCASQPIVSRQLVCRRVPEQFRHTRPSAFYTRRETDLRDGGCLQRLRRTPWRLPCNCRNNGSLAQAPCPTFPKEMGAVSVLPEAKTQIVQLPCAEHLPWHLVSITCSQGTCDPQCLVVCKDSPYVTTQELC